MKYRTQRLLISSISLDYINEVHQLHSLPEVDRFNTLGIPASVDVTKKIMLQWLEIQEADPATGYVFSVKLIDTNEFIGVAGLNLGKPNYRIGEIWYKLDPRHWNKGYASEALAEILKMCFIKLKLHRIEAGCAVDNTASIKVLEKAGFVREGRKRAILPVRGEWMDNYFYAILDNDYNNLNK
ncbi:MAG: GNAT family N-acetyltransferase [Rhizobacter sp.]|nr:GNAT family N-acetyltransferase [Ferruginibacter sp.]